MSQRKCAACHHAALPLWALSEADRRGYPVDKKYLAQTFEATLGSRDKMMASGLINNPANPPDTRPMARGVNMGLPFMAVAARSLPSLDDGQKKSLRFISDEIVQKQQADGSWEFFLSRPPINESQATDVAWIIMALQGDTGPDAQPGSQAAAQKGMAWLEGAEPDNQEAKILKVLVALRAGKNRDTMQRAIDAVLARQRPDGGWNQTTETKSDAFATGQVLYVLSLAGYGANQAGVKRGMDYLLATQKADGSWPMVSRATPDGRPGSAKLLTPITCGATSWAVLGLVELDSGKHG